MRKLFFLLLLVLVYTLIPRESQAYKGNCSIQVQPLGFFVPYYTDGDTLHFGQQRDYCLRQGGGVIVIGAGCENLTFTYPANANLLVIKNYKSGWCADPFLSGCPLPSSTITSIFDVGGITSASGQCVVWALKGITPNFFFKVFGGTQVGFDSAKVFVGTKGLIIRGPGCEQNVVIGTISDSVSVMALDGGSFKSFGKMMNAYDRTLTSRFQVDSIGAHVPDTLEVGSILKVKGTNGNYFRFKTGNTVQQAWNLPTSPGSGYLNNDGANNLTWGATAVDTTNFFWRPGKPTGGQTGYGNLFGYSGINAGLILRGFTDIGTVDSTAELTLDNVAQGEARFKANVVSMFARTGTKGWSIALNSAGNRGDVTQDGSYDLQPVTTGTGLRIIMTNSGTGIKPFELKAKSGSTVNQLELQNSSGTFQAGFSKEWFVKVGASVFASLPSSVDGTMAYCSDCTTTDPPTAGGTGAIISRLSGAWRGTGGLANPLVVIDTLRVTGVTDLNSTLTQFQGVDVASATSTTLGVGNMFLITGTTPITSITIKPAGTKVSLVCNSCNLVDGSNLNLNGDFTGDGSGGFDTLNLFSDGSVWNELGRSTN